MGSGAGGLLHKYRLAPTKSARISRFPPSSKFAPNILVSPIIVIAAKGEGGPVQEDIVSALALLVHFFSSLCSSAHALLLFALLLGSCPSSLRFAPRLRLEKRHFSDWSQEVLPHSWLRGCWHELCESIFHDAPICCATMGFLLRCYTILSLSRVPKEGFGRWGRDVGVREVRLNASDRQALRSLHYSILACSLMLIRCMVIATKYAHFKPENLKRMEQGTSQWNSDDSDSAMMLAGWGNKPRKLDGVLQGCIDHGMGITDVDLTKVNFSVYDEDAKFGASAGVGVQLPAISVLSRVITSKFGARFFTHPYFVKLSMVGSFLIALVGPLTR